MQKKTKIYNTCHHYPETNANAEIYQNEKFINNKKNDNSNRMRSLRAINNIGKERPRCLLSQIKFLSDPMNIPELDNHSIFLNYAPKQKIYS